MNFYFLETTIVLAVKIARAIFLKVLGLFDYPAGTPVTLRWQLLSANNKESINLIGVNHYPKCPIAQVEFYRHRHTALFN